MADVPVKGYQTLWMNKLSAMKSEYQKLVQQYPEADAQLKQLLQVVGDIEDVQDTSRPLEGKVRNGLPL
jgi:hypothetical protein